MADLFDPDTFLADMTKGQKVKAFFYPEVMVGGFTRRDGAVEFFKRINILLKPNDVLLDFGAGRGAGIADDNSPYRRALRTWQGKVQTVIACDVDPVVKEHVASDQQVILEKNQPLPFEDASVDIIVVDWVLEHVDTPDALFDELYRVLKPGGWICARTLNQYWYIAILSKLIKNTLHASLLKWAQPERKEQDVFPTFYRFNNMKKVSVLCQRLGMINHSYRYTPEPAYFFNSRIVFGLLSILDAVLPRCMKPHLMIFLRKS